MRHHAEADLRIFFASGAARTDNVRQLASSLLRPSVIEIGVQLHVKNVNIIS